MCAPQEAAVTLAACDLLTALGRAGQKFTVTVATRDHHHSWTVRDWGAPPKAPPATPAAPPGWRRLSPLEAKILGGLAGKGWVVTADLAAAIGEEPSSDFRAIVRNLAEAGVVETCQRRGLRLTAGGEH